MTSTLSAPIHAGSRHPLWYLPLLFGVLPTVGTLGRDSGDPGAATMGLVVLTLLGALLVVVVLPMAFNALGEAGRKEIEQLRPSWIASVFIVQATMLAEPDGAFMLIVFGATCAVLASLPFGLEFQHRTLPGLLTQPADRSALWQAKCGVLAAALALHLLIACLSAMPVARPAGLWTFAGLAAVAAIAAWCTTPWWTLVTRNLIAGLVFSIAAPLLVAAGFALADDVVRSVALRQDLWNEIEPVWSRFTSTVTAVLATLYVLGAALLGYRAWLRLEATDQGAVESVVVLPRRRRSDAVASSRATHPLAALLGKEFRLQSVTVLCAAATGAFALGRGLATETDARNYLLMVTVLLAATTILLAGATAIAEERRLGTLDGQVLLPVGRWTQFAIKTGVAALLAASAGLTLWLVFRTFQGIEAPTLANLVLGTVLGAAALVCTLFLSSASSSTLRALMGGLLFFVLAVAMTSMAFRMAAESLSNSLERESAVGLSDPWVQRAAGLGETGMADLERRHSGASALQRTVLGLGMSAILPLGVALVFAARNFASPAAAPRRLIGQALVCLLVLGGTMIADLGWVRSVARASLEFHTLRTAWMQLKWRDRLSPAERTLWETFRPSSWAWTARVPFMVPELPGTTIKRLDVQLPLSPESRALILERGQLDPQLKDALRSDVSTASPTGSPQGSLPAVDEKLLQRYGLLPRPGGDHPAMDEVMLQRYGLSATNAGAIPPTQQRHYQMSPDLMRRYGLLPARFGNPPTNPATNPPAP